MTDPIARLRTARPGTVPISLAAVHRACEVGDLVTVEFAAASEQRAADLAIGGGFAIEEFAVVDRRAHAHLRRLRTLPDTVGPSMRALVSGLNPSVYAADAGVAFARPGNRFWSAALAAELVEVDRSPDDALARSGVGMTDLVKRATPRADELTIEEYREGMARIERLCNWLRPAVVIFVGLAGWRAAVEPRTAAGLQPRRVGGCSVYVMPSTSGLNASSTLDDLTTHLRRAVEVASTRR